jgi:hypothetical protein
MSGDTSEGKSGSLQVQKSKDEDLFDLQRQVTRNVTSWGVSSYYGGSTENHSWKNNILSFTPERHRPRSHLKEIMYLTEKRT